MLTQPRETQKPAALSAIGDGLLMALGLAPISLARSQDVARLKRRAHLVSHPFVCFAKASVSAGKTVNVDFHPVQVNSVFA